MPFLVFLFSSLVPAQVIIKEKVEINPQNYLVNSPNNPTEPTFTYILSWKPGQYRRGKIQIISCYGDTTDTGWTSGGYATTSMPGRGNHIFKFVNERWYYDSYLGWGWYYDSNNDIERKVLINNQELNTSNLIGADIGTIDIPMLIFNDDICDSGFVKLELEPTNWADCEEIGWLPIDQLNLRITTGSEYASFYNIRTGTNLGSQTQINPFVKLENLGLFFGFEWEKDGLDDVVIKIDENIPADSVPVYIEVKAEINGVEFAGGNIFYPDKLLIITEINPLEITTGEETSISVEVFNRCEPIDPFTTINLEIISGEEFGSLIDPYTDEKVKIITDHYLFWGYAWIDYVADGISPDETAEVKIRISTSSPGIPPKEITIYIKPSPIYVYTVPEVLGANEEANVIIKKRNPDGTLEDFPPEQTFELAVLDGCVNGNFMVGDSINVYFADAMQPIYFVAADSVAGDSGIVRLRVGTDFGGSALQPLMKDDDKDEKLNDEQTRIAELKAGYKKMIEEKKKETIELKDSKQGEPPSEAPILEVCYYGSYLYETGYWEGDVVVKQDECDFDSCSNSYNDIQIQVLRQLNNFEYIIGERVDTLTVCVVDSGDTTKPVGSSSPVPYDRLRKNHNGEWKKSWFLNECNHNKLVEFRMLAPDLINSTPIFIDFVADICYDLIASDTLTLVNDTTALADTSIVHDANKALRDICGHNCYPQIISKKGYIIKEIIEKHELLHLSHYEKILNDTKADSLIKGLSELKFTCQTYNMVYDSLEQVANNFESKINQYVTKAIREYYKQSGKKYTDVSGNVHSRDLVQEKKNEESIHYVPAIYSLVSAYHFALHNSRGTPWPVTTCMTCP